MNPNLPFVIDRLSENAILIDDARKHIKTIQDRRLLRRWQKYLGRLVRNRSYWEEMSKKLNNS